MLRWQVTVLAAVVALALRGTISAQEATPSADRQENTHLVDPAECIAKPVDTAKITQMLGLDGTGVPAPAKHSITPPLGLLADAATGKAIDKLTREIVACYNAQDVARSAALMTEQGFQRAYWELTIDQASRERTKQLLAAKPQPRDKDALIRLVAVTDPVVLADNRVAAFVVLDEPLLPPNGPETLLFIFAKQDDSWRFDDLVDFTVVPPSATPQAATPTS
jgi:hypothetical protein